VGQFQNRQTAAGWLFLTSETLLAATTVVTSALWQSYQAQGVQGGVDWIELNSRQSTAKTINNAAFFALIGVMVGGVVHAQWTFVPERRVTKERPLPKSLTVTPTASALPSGGWLGLQGSF